MSDSKEAIQERLLSNIDDSFDKSDGSFFYDAEMPVAIELEKSYADLDAILDKGFPDTAAGSYLDKIVSEQGLTRKLASQATTVVTITGVIGSNINIGDKVASDNVNFIFTEAKTIDVTGITTVAVICETPGTIGNVPIGAIKYFPVTLQGLTTVTNTSPVTNGYAEETNEDLRLRYYAKVQSPATSGNASEYANWAKSITGVGDAKVFPIWNGNGTVKVVIINSNKRAADPTLVTSVTDFIETVRPIGATVTVESATELEINISANLTLADGYILSDITTALIANITDYLADIAFVDSYVSYAKIGSVILNTEGVFDHSNLLINNGTANINIADTQVAVIGTVTV